MAIKVLILFFLVGCSLQQEIEGTKTNENDEKGKKIIQWIEESGGMVDGIHISYDLYKGRGVYATRKLNAGHRAASIPSNTFMAITQGIDPDVTPASSLLTRVQQMPSNALAILIMVEYCRGHDSPWFPFLQNLPTAEEMTSPLLFSSQDLAQFHNTSISVLLYRRSQAVKRNFENLFPMLMRDFPHLFPATCFKSNEKAFELFSWALSTIWSRTITVPFLQVIMSGQEKITKPIMEQRSPALVPLADMFNFNRSPNVDTRIEKSSPIIQESQMHSVLRPYASTIIHFYITRNVNEGEELSVAYNSGSGEVSGAELALDYGISPDYFSGKLDTLYVNLALAVNKGINNGKLNEWQELNLDASIDPASSSVSCKDIPTQYWSSSPRLSAQIGQLLVSFGLLDEDQAKEATDISKILKEIPEESIPTICEYESYVNHPIHVAIQSSLSPLPVINLARVLVASHLEVDFILTSGLDRPPHKPITSRNEYAALDFITHFCKWQQEIWPSTIEEDSNILADLNSAHNGTSKDAHQSHVLPDGSNTNRDLSSKSNTSLKRLHLAVTVRLQDKKQVKQLCTHNIPRMIELFNSVMNE